MRTSWVVSVELHTLPGGEVRGPHAGERILSPGHSALLAARERGYRTAVLAADPDQYRKQYDDLVDAWLPARTLDASAAAYRLKELNGDVAAVFSSVDSFVRVAAGIARDQGLPGPSPLGAGIARDKAVARAALSAAGIPDIRWAVRSARDADLSSPIGYPCVVKPVDGACSWDVALVSGEEAVHRLAARHLAREYGRRVVPQRRLLFEEVLRGPLYSAEGFVDRDEVRILGYSDRILSQPPYFVELATRFAAERPFPEADEYVARTLAALDYDLGAFHLEFVLTERGPRLVELNPRFIGGGMQHGISRLAGARPADLMMAKLTRNPAPVLLPRRAVTELHLTAPASGRLHEVRGLEAAVAVPGCYAAGCYVPLGAEVSDVVESNSQCVGYVHAVGDSREESSEIAREAASHVAMDIR